MEGQVTAVLQLSQGSAKGFPSPLREQPSQSTLCLRDFCSFCLFLNCRDQVLQLELPVRPFRSFSVV